MNHKVFLSLGSNIGDRLSYLKNALKLIEEHQDFTTLRVSSFYETDPVGYVDQDPFLNCVLEVETDLTPYKVLEQCMGIEQILERKRIIRWGPRTIDIDILLYDELTMNDDELTIPHPRMSERAFVLIPLYEIWNEGMINQRSLKDHIERVDTKGIRKL